jgi:hypothetical protein
MQPKLIGSILVCLLIVLLMLGNLALSKKGANEPQGCLNGKGLMECPEGSGQCVNTQVDDNNCGECGNICEAGEICQGGDCVSSPCQKKCNDGNQCTNDFCERGVCVNTPVDDAAACACVAAGGTVTTRLCCMLTSDFPNTCVIGACGCSQGGSKVTRICNCGEGMCFDGTTCVAIAS